MSENTTTSTTPTNLPRTQVSSAGQPLRSTSNYSRDGSNTPTSTDPRGSRKRTLRLNKEANKKKSFSKFKKRNQVTDTEYESKVMEVRRVTRVVKGGKRMRFSALVVVGNKDGKVGYAIKKGLDYQDAVNKATRRAKLSLIHVSVDENLSLAFESKTKLKASELYLKPAKSGTGLIAGGFLRPVLELVGVKNIYSKIIGSRNKISGTQAVFAALKKYSKDSEKTVKVPEIV